MLKGKEQNEVTETPKMEVEPEVINTPMGTTTVNVNPGSKVEIIGIDKDVNGVEIPNKPEFGFSIISKNKKGNLIIVAENVTLEVKPENIRNVK